jgi:hypothetical protein
MAVMKKLTFLISLVLGISAHTAQASMECMGVAGGGKYVKVFVQTAGERAVPSEGMVTIYDQENQYGYRIEKADLTQYYERALFNSPTTFVGALAYVLGENPVEIFYSGENFADQDLLTVLQTAGRQKIPGNEMVVWKGPNYGPTEQYNLTDVVCGVWADF